MSQPLDRLTALGLALPQPAAPIASYVPTVRVGDLLYVSGQLPLAPDGTVTVQGQLGDTVDLEESQQAAQLCALNVLAQVNQALGGLDRVVRVVKLTVFVCSTPLFTDHAKVANGASDLFGEVFGEAGRHARAAVGVAALPRGAAVEIDAIIQVA